MDRITMPSALLSRILLTQDPRQKQVVIGHRERSEEICPLRFVASVARSPQLQFSRMIKLAFGLHITLDFDNYLDSDNLPLMEFAVYF